MTPLEWKFGQAFTDGAVVRFAVGTEVYGDAWASVDAADWPGISHRRWRATRRKRLFYVRSGATLLHRYLTGGRWPVVDHVDGNGLNNCRSNLRRCETVGENTVHGGDRRRGCTKAEFALNKWLSKSDAILEQNASKV